MTETREDIMERLFPGYGDTKRALESYSDWELGLIMDNIPECPEDLEDSITKEVQWSIVDTLFGQLISNWDDFISDNEGLVMDYCYDTVFLGYNYENKSYSISRETVIDICKDLLSEVDEEYSINENVDFRDIISDLNKYYPIKFFEELLNIC